MLPLFWTSLTPQKKLALKQLQHTRQENIGGEFAFAGVPFSFRSSTVFLGVGINNLVSSNCSSENMDVFSYTCGTIPWIYRYRQSNLHKFIICIFLTERENGSEGIKSRAPRSIYRIKRIKLFQKESIACSKMSFVCESAQKELNA